MNTQATEKRIRDLEGLTRGYLVELLSILDQVSEETVEELSRRLREARDLAFFAARALVNGGRRDPA